MNKILLSAFAVAMMLVTACSSEDEKSYPDTPEKETQQEENNRPPETPKTRVDVPLSERQKEIMESKGAFDFNFFKNAYSLASTEEREQFVVSPYSASVFMAMLTQGADDNLRENMMKTLVPAGADAEEMTAMMKLISESLADIDNAVQFKEANSVWYDNEVVIGADFSKVMTDYFNATVSQCDMFSKKGGEQINNWVKEATEGMIDRIVPEMPLTMLLMADAIYFRGTWTEPFSEKDTRKYDFTNASGSKSSVDMMIGSPSGYGYKGNGFQVFSLPYGNKAYSMSIILPEGSTDEFIGKLTPELWREIKNDLKEDSYAVRLPKFSVTNDNFELKDVLSAAGFDESFTNQARYSRIIKDFTGDNIKILQTAKLKVDEKGTEGAAVTWGAIYGADVTTGGPEPTKFYVDRPFVFIIDEVSTGAVLFAGVINKL